MGLAVRWPVGMTSVEAARILSAAPQSPTVPLDGDVGVSGEMDSRAPLLPPDPTVAHDNCSGCGNDRGNDNGSADASYSGSDDADANANDNGNDDGRGHDNNDNGHDNGSAHANDDGSGSANANATCEISTPATAEALLFLEQLDSDNVGQTAARSALLGVVESAAANTTWQERDAIAWVDEVLRLRPSLAEPPAGAEPRLQECACGYAPPADARFCRRCGRPCAPPDPPRPVAAPSSEAQLSVDQPGWFFRLHDAHLGAQLPTEGTTSTATRCVDSAVSSAQPS